MRGGFWHDAENQRKYLELVASKLRISTRVDWYNVSIAQLIQHGGSGLLKCYGGSLRRVLEANYSDFDWKPWLFDHTPSQYWNSVAHRKEFLRWLSAELEVKHWEQWYVVALPFFLSLSLSLPLPSHLFRCLGTDGYIDIEHA